LKGLILSGGKGTRLRPITHTSAKQLVPLANRPILFYAIEAIRDAGVTDIGIIVGDTKKEIEEAVGDGSDWGVKITCIEQKEPLGLAHAVLTAEDFIGDAPFVMYLGDNLLMGGINDFVGEFESNSPNAFLLLVEVPDPEHYGIAELDGDGKVMRLREKPQNPQSNLAISGIYMFDRNIFDAARAIKPSERGELEITDAIQYLVDKGMKVDSHIIQGWWKDTGKLEDMLEANRILLDSFQEKNEGSVDSKSSIEGRVVIQQGAEIINSVIRGPAIIGKNTKIINSFVGPYTSIYYDVILQESEIEHSIVLEGSKILDIDNKIVDSLIGKNVEISRSTLKPQAYRFMVGDYSKVGIL
jgi:glucose-1-phosphate thymidylyltransferase